MYKKMINVFRWFLVGIDATLNFYLIPLLRKKLFSPSFDRLWQTDGARFNRWVLKIFKLNTEYTNLHKVDLSKQYIIVANHRSWFDQHVIVDSMPRGVHFVSNYKYSEVPFFGKGLEIFEAILVKDGKMLEKDKDQIGRYLERGDNLLFYPEGTRSVGKNLLPFRSGAFHLAAKYNIPILPIFIENAEDVLKKTESIFDAREGITLRVQIQEPIFLSEENRQEAMKNLEAKFFKQWRELRQIDLL